MTFESQHDAARQGRLKADPADPAAKGGDLFSVLDLVPYIEDRDDVSTVNAEARALAAVPVDKEAPSLFMTRLRRDAELVTDAAVWRPRVEERQAGVREHVRRANAYSATQWGNGASQFETKRVLVSARASDAGLYGEAGAWSLLRQLWSCDGDKKRAAILKEFGPRLARLAITAQDAFEWFGCGQPAGVAPGWPSSVEAAGIAKSAHAHHDQSGPSADEWTDERMANRLAELKRQTPTLKAPMNDLLAEMGLEVNSANRRDVQRKVKTFNVDRQPASLATVWIGRSVHRA